MSAIIDLKGTGENIRSIMQELKFSATDIQERLGLASVQSVYHWITGRSLPTVDHLVELAAILGVTVDEILAVKKEG